MKIIILAFILIFALSVPAQNLNFDNMDSAKLLSLLQSENLDSKKFLKGIEIERFLAGKFRQSQLYKKVWALERPNTEKYQLLFEVLHQLTGYSFKGQTLTLLDLAIIDAQKKIKSRSEKE